MNQKKILELERGVSFMAVVDSTNETTVYLNVGNKRLTLDSTSILQLRDWLSKEVLLEAPVITNVIIPSNGKYSSGPIISQPGMNPILPTELENRKAVITSGGIKDLSSSTELITKRDELQVHNLGGSIQKAKEAFSPEHINEG
jgi:hypothetical protein